MKIRAYLVLLAAVMTIPMFLVSVWALNMLDQAGQRAALRSMHETARAGALIIDRELYASEIRLRVFAASAELASGDLRALHASMKKASRSAPDGWLLMLDDAGQQVLNTRVDYGVPLPSVANRQQMEQLFGMDRPFVSNLVDGPLSRSLQVAVAIPVQMDDGRRYALVEALTTGLFDRLLREGNVPASWTQALFDRDGRFIARSRNADRLIGKPARPELVEAAQQRHTGQIRHSTWEDIESWDVFTHTSHGNWTMAVAAPVPAIEGAGRRASLIAAAGFLAALLLAGGAAWMFGRRLVRSLDRASQASAMLVRGEAPPRTDSTILEMQDLHLALNRAAELIRDERASRRAAELERERLLEVEQQARARAEDESKSKDAFLAMLGHELRNPLSAISAGAAVVRAAGTDAEVARRANDIIGRQSAHLERIVDDLLDTARMLAGKVKLVRTRQDLADSVRHCVDAMRAAGKLDHHALHVDAAPVTINADPARIDQIINNLLINAVKYTPAGGAIDITVREEGGAALLAVSDNGIGMQPELLERAFDPFVQGRVSLDRSQGGLGIGLTLVRKLVELHGGTVWAESAGEGLGSRFVVRLPLATESDASRPAGAATASPGEQLLLVEDNDDARDMTAELLRASGYQVTAVASGTDALLAARQQAYLVAVVDIGLPDISGYEVVRQLRQWPETRRMGLVALTGYGLAADVSAALEAGFDVHLVKPVNYQRLIDAIESLRARQGPAAATAG